MSTELRGLLARLVALLDAAGVPFMVAGSFASTAHGMPRTTQDLDLVIDPPNAAALVRSMAPEQYYVDADAARDALARRSMFNVVDLASGWKVDLIVRSNGPIRSVPSSLSTWKTAPQLSRLGRRSISTINIVLRGLCRLFGEALAFRNLVRFPAAEHSTPTEPYVLPG